MGRTFDEHLAEREAQSHRASTRLWAPRPHLLGMIGEKELCEFFGVAQDFTNKPAGDGGIDRWLTLSVYGKPQRFPCDVKASSYGDYLRVDAAKIDRHTQAVYILCHIVDGRAQGLVGWEWKTILKKAPTKDWCGNGVVVHYLHRKDLRKMRELKDHFLAID